MKPKIKTRIKQLILLCTTMLSAPFTYSADWRLDLEKDGIKVYTAKAEQSQKMKFRGEANFQANIKALEKAFQDVNSISKWQYPSYDLKMMEESDNAKLVYMKQKAPSWALLVKDRDVVLKYSIHKDKNSLRVILNSVSGKMEKQKGFVRLKSFEGEWLIQQINENEVSVRYEAFVDPGGVLPAAVTNTLVTDTPYKTLSLLRSHLESDDKNSEK